MERRDKEEGAWRCACVERNVWGGDVVLTCLCGSGISALSSFSFVRVVELAAVAFFAPSLCRPSCRLLCVLRFGFATVIPNFSTVVFPLFSSFFF